MTEYKLTVMPLIPASHKRKYPFQSMEVGDTFLLDPKERKKLASAAANYAKRHGIKLVVRNYTHEGKQYVACQRQELEDVTIGNDILVDTN